MKRSMLRSGSGAPDLKHPRIVRVYDLVVDDDSGMAYFEMDLVLSPIGQPRTLADEQRDGVSEEQVVSWFHDICEGLAYIHSQGIVHRDMSLDNILIGPDGHAVITDFGIAKIIDDSYRRKIDVTVTMVAMDGAELRMGKGLYMAPELKKPNGKATFASDAYAVGVILFRLLSGSWYDVGTHLEDWLAEFEYNWLPVISQLCNEDPEKRLGDGGIVALVWLLKYVASPLPFGCRKWVMVSGIVALLLILVCVYFAEHASTQAVDKSRYTDVERRQIYNREVVATDMPLVATVASAIDDMNISQKIVRLTELVQSNLWTTSLPSELVGSPTGKVCNIYSAISERRLMGVDLSPGADVYLTIGRQVQDVVEKELYVGLTNCGARAGWAIVLDSHKGAVLAMATCSAVDSKDCYKKNLCISEAFEPGSVMKVITACAALNDGKVSPETMISTARDCPDYYQLPGDGTHKWQPFMSVRDGLVHSSNIVYGKLGYRLGPERLWHYFKAFGFGKKTGIDLPGEVTGILPDYKKWGKASWSRASIGQFVTVTPIQMVVAYGAVANGGRLMKPYIVDRIVNTDGEEVFHNEPEEVGRPISADTARRVREMMLGVAMKGGTARRAAVGGYSVAGKTSTTKVGYSSVNYNASFIGIVPAHDPVFVVLVSYQHPEYCSSFQYHEQTGLPLSNHQGGVCAASVFSHVAAAIAPCLGVEPDKLGVLDELL